MKTRVIMIFLLASLVPLSGLSVLAGSLSVGTKVIYPGGADQPPKEKDTGVSLKADVVGIARGSESDTQEANEHFQQMLDFGEYEKLIDEIGESDDPEILSLKALALYYNDEDEAAFELANKLLKNKKLSQETKDYLCRELDLKVQPEPENEN